MSLFTGSGVALVTPFTEDFEVNYDMLEKLIKWHIAMKTDALIICGTTGESATLSKDEKKKVIEFSIKVANHQIPIIAGTGSNDTMATVELSQFAKNVGADALLLVTPYYNKPSQRGLYAHFEYVASRVNLPIILYNVPGRTGVNLLPETVLKLAKIKNIVAVKEASGNLEQINEIITKVPLDFDVYSGNDDQTKAIMKMGGKGVISVTANVVPGLVHEIATNHDLPDHLKKLHDVMFIDSNPVPAKFALCYLGLNVGPARLPLVELTESDKEKVIAVLNAFGLKEGAYESFN